MFSHVQSLPALTKPPELLTTGAKESSSSSHGADLSITEFTLLHFHYAFLLMWSKQMRSEVHNDVCSNDHEANEERSDPQVEGFLTQPLRTFVVLLIVALLGQHRENQRHNIDWPCRAETGEHGETEVVPQRGDLLSLPVPQEVSAPVQGGLSFHDGLQRPLRH